MADQDEDTGQDIVIEQEGEEEEQKVFVSTTDDDESELETYSKGVQKRIARLTKKFRKEEMDREEAVRVAQNISQLTVAPLIGEAIKRISQESSVSSLFD